MRPLSVHVTEIVETFKQAELSWPWKIAANEDRKQGFWKIVDSNGVKVAVLQDYRVASLIVNAINLAVMDDQTGEYVLVTRETLKEISRLVDLNGPGWAFSEPFSKLPRVEWRKPKEEEEDE